MPTLTIRKLDDTIIDQLRRRARANNRSLEAELRTILRDFVRQPEAAAWRPHAGTACLTPAPANGDGGDPPHKEH